MSKTEQLEAVNDELRQRLSLGEDENLRLERQITRLRAALFRIATADHAGKMELQVAARDALVREE